MYKSVLIFDVNKVVDIGRCVKNGISIVDLNIVNKCWRFRNVYCVGFGLFFILRIGWMVCLNICLFFMLIYFFL